MTTATTTARGHHLFNIGLNIAFSLKARVLTSCAKMERKEVVFVTGYKMNKPKSIRQSWSKYIFQKEKKNLV